MTDFVTSTDGTRIGYRQFGQGPGLIVVHGGMQASQHYTRLAAALAERFTLYVPDRRGRGMSGSPGDHHALAREREDIAALVAKTGAAAIFGLSSGAIISLDAALHLPQLRKAALYEPPFPSTDSPSPRWTSRFDQEIADGRLGAALATALKTLQLEPRLGRLPRFVLVPLLNAAIKRRDRGEGDDVPLRALIPTQRSDNRLVAETLGTMDRYRGVSGDVLLLGGSQSPRFLATALDALQHILPRARRLTFPGLNHSGPANTGQPEIVARELAKFFAE